MRRWEREVTGPGVTPGRTSLAETATLDAGLAQQLTVLLLRHTLATLLDHGAHTKCLSKTMWGRSLRTRRHTRPSLTAARPSPDCGQTHTGIAGRTAPA